MPLPEKETQKLYYTISEVAAMLNVSASLIRYWETEFTFLKPRKNRKGNRMFTVQDIDNIRLIYYLVKECGYTLEGAKKQLKTAKAELKKKEDLVNSLQSIKNALLKFADALDPAAPIPDAPDET